MLVFDTTDGYFTSRDIFQQLFTYGNFGRIACVSKSATLAKKMMLGREARYSGLIDVLEIIEADDVSAPAVAQAAAFDVWMILNAQQSALGGQIAAAKAAGAKRLLLTVNEGGLTDKGALEGLLAASGLQYTVMRTGELSKSIEGSALVSDTQPARLEAARRPRLAASSPRATPPPHCPRGAAQRIDAVDCASAPAVISRTDAFRVAVEALTIDSALGKMFSLCPADRQQTSAVFKEMRYAGVDRRQEVVALLSGTVDSRASEIEASEVKAAAVAEEKAAKDKAQKMGDFESMPSSSKEEVEAAFARARARAKFVAEEEAVKLAAIEEKRAERQKSQSMIEARIAEVARAKSGGGEGGGTGMTDDEDPRGPQKPKASDDGEGGGGGAGGKPGANGGGGDGGKGGGKGGGEGGKGGDGPVATV